MQHWSLLEQIFTAQTIMTPITSLVTWDGVESLASVWERADAFKIDTIPVLKNGAIGQVIQRGNETPLPLTYAWVVTRDASIPVIVAIFAMSSKKCLMVLAGQAVVGVVTPADLNKLSARTYFYNLIAELEITLAQAIHKRGFTHDELFNLLGDDQKRQEEIQTKLTNSELELELIHTLYLSEMVNIIKDDTTLRKTLGFPSNSQVKKQLNTLVHFRNDIMHPNNLILNDNHGVKDLHERIEKIARVLKRVAINI